MRQTARTSRRPPEPAKAGAEFPWVSSRTLQFTAHGEYQLSFPPACPIRLMFMVFDTEHQVTPSYHDYLELAYITEGRGRFVVENRVYPVSAGDLIFVGPREFHLLRANHVQPLRVIALHFQQDLVCRPGSPPLDFEYLRPFLHRGPGFRHRISADELPDGLVPARLRDIHREVHGPQPCHPLVVKTYLCDLLLEISRHVQSRAPGQGRQRVLGRHFERLQPLFVYLGGHFAEPLNLVQAAAMVNLSPTYLCRFFKAVTGNTMTEYVLRLRIDRAMELLSGTSRSVTEIAYETGFTSHSYFDRIFRRFTGLTPKQYRSQPGAGG